MFRSIFLFALSAALCNWSAHAGGPRYVAGSTYFDSSHKGKPVIWAEGAVSYYTDLGALSAAVDNATANATVAAAASAWNAVPTAAVSLTRSGALFEDVNGSNVLVSAAGVALPDDIRSSAISRPLSIVYDADGAVIDAFLGVGASDPDDCFDSGVIPIVDNFASDATIVHAVILVNGRCAATTEQLTQIQFQLIRAFGRVLGLGWSQANDAVLSSGTPPSYEQLLGWPIMRPIDSNCNQLSTQCIPNALQLRPDDIAAVSRLYPVTNANIASFPGKQLTSGATISIHGSIYFRRGQGMQGVNVVARPIARGVSLPDDRFPVSSVSGFLFTGDRGNPVSGILDASGEALSDFGSDEPMLEGFYDLSGIILPPGETSADYQLVLEPVNSLYSGSLLVGPYSVGTPLPSGTMSTFTLRGLSAGMSVEQDISIYDSSGDLQSGQGGSFTDPLEMPRNGSWSGRLSNIGGAGWFSVPVLAGRHFTIESEALDESGQPAEDKVRPVIGVWNASAWEGSPPTVATIEPFNGAQVGVTGLGVDAISDGELLFSVADQRGDGRPDYIYKGRLLYAANVYPARLSLGGGTIRIVGAGFHPGMTVSLGTQVSATIFSISPTTIVARVPPSNSPSGSLDLVVRDPLTNGSAIIAAGISYGDANDDSLSIASPLPTALIAGSVAPWTVRVFAADQITPISGVLVSFAITSGSATLNGSATDTAATSPDGFATVLVQPSSAGVIKVRATLTSGATVSSEFTASSAIALVPMRSSIFLAPGATVSWPAQVTAVQNGLPMTSVPITWTVQSPTGSQTSSVFTDAQGTSSLQVVLGPWTAGTSVPLTACLPSNLCTTQTVFVVHPEAESLVEVSGTNQKLNLANVPAPIVVRLVATPGLPVFGGIVHFAGALRGWTPSCDGSLPCARGRFFRSISQDASTDADGVVSFIPSIPVGIPLFLSGQAEAGTAAVLPFTLSLSP